MRSRLKTPEFERRTRIDCRFPMNRMATQQVANQVRVVIAFLTYLLTTDITGFTLSSLMDNVDTGFWRPRQQVNSKRKTW